MTDLPTAQTPPQSFADAIDAQAPGPHDDAQIEELTDDIGTLADLTADLATDPAGEPTIREVLIPACKEHNGFAAITVRLRWVCPRCGEPRGVPERGLSYDGSQRLAVDVWANACEHVDYYDLVRAEAAENGLNAVQLVGGCLVAADTPADTPADSSADAFDPDATQPLDDSTVEAANEAANGLARMALHHETHPLARLLDEASATIRLLNAKAQRLEGEVAAVKLERDGNVASLKLAQELLDETMAAKVQLDAEFQVERRARERADWLNRELTKQLERADRETGMLREILLKSKKATEPATTTTPSQPATVVQIDTLLQKIGRPDDRSRANADLAEKLAEGWGVLHVSHNVDSHPEGHIWRIVTLIRDVPAPQPQPEMHAELQTDLQTEVQTELISVAGVCAPAPAMTPIPSITFHPPRPVPAPMNQGQYQGLS